MSPELESAFSQNTIPVMMDRVQIQANAAGEMSAWALVKYNHLPGGGNVLYMDGHTKFIKYSKDGEFPMNNKFGYIYRW